MPVEIKNKNTGDVIHIIDAADLSGADLRSADLRGANMSYADLSYADLNYADLSGAILSGAILSDAKLNWQSHALLSELLRRAAGDDIERRMVAGLVAVSTDWCWDRLLTIEHGQREWALNTLAEYVVDEDDAPEVMWEWANNIKSTS